MMDEMLPFARRRKSPTMSVLLSSLAPVDDSVHIDPDGAEEALAVLELHVAVPLRGFVSIERAYDTSSGTCHASRIYVRRDEVTPAAQSGGNPRT